MGKLDNKTILILDNETGEVETANGRYQTKEELENIDKHRQRQLAIENGRDNPFVEYLFEYGTEAFPDLSPASITRLFFVATYCGYDGRLMLTAHRTMDKKQLKKLLGLSDTSFKAFWSEITESGILILREDGTIEINNKYFAKGKLTSEQKKNNFTRVYCKMIQDIYKSFDKPSSHKTLSYIFKLIPYVNLKHNLVCRNPGESDVDQVQPLTVGEFCDILGYDRTHGRRLLQNLLDLKIGDQHLLGLWGHSLNVYKHVIFVNPRVFYAGANPNEIRDTFDTTARFELIE